VVEVNTLNPGGLHMIQEFTGLDLTAPVIQWLEAHVATQISLRLPPRASSP
jgi:glutathione synthase/RimK-type ligase-like ATP-grasp enzyme